MKFREYINEGKLSSDRQHLLNTLIADFKTVTDPSYLDDEDNEELPSKDEIINKIRSEFGDKIASQIEDGEYEFHFGREYTKYYDRKEWYTKNNSFTKDGKMNKNSINKMKNFYKRGY